MLADEYMRNTKLDKEPTTKTTAQLVLLHIDDHAWASVIHYLTGTKFLLQPDTYTKFCLDSGDPISQWTAAQVKLLSQKLPITKEHERDWHEQRKVDAWRRALLAKFAQNEDLQRALILTGWAKLVDRNGIPQHLLMWVRTVLRGDHQQQQQEEAQQEEEILLERGKRKREEEGVTEESKQTIMSSITKSKDDKNIEEVLRVIEGLFGKDRQQILSSILTGTPPTDQPRETVPKKPIEAKPVEMKDAVGYLEQIKNDEPPQTYHKFLEIMTDFRSEKINTPQVLERVTALFKGKPWLIRNFLMFLPPGHVLNLSPENKSNSIYITSPTGSKIIIHTDEGIITFE
ncbi:hypothetical protein EDC96DRAFT_265958 [Choanephora cucurbitarum]|nr:hypothetical protein EDC96DRAFT_265958 [Choanephora cucurbitarum]